MSITQLKAFQETPRVDVEDVSENIERREESQAPLPATVQPLMDLMHETTLQQADNDPYAAFVAGAKDFLDASAERRLEELLDPGIVNAFLDGVSLEHLSTFQRWWKKLQPLTVPEFMNRATYVTAAHAVVPNRPSRASCHEQVDDAWVDAWLSTCLPLLDDPQNARALVPGLLVLLLFDVVFHAYAEQTSPEQWQSLCRRR